MIAVDKYFAYCEKALPGEIKFAVRFSRKRVSAFIPLYEQHSCGIRDFADRRHHSNDGMIDTARDQKHWR